MQFRFSTGAVALALAFALPTPARAASEADLAAIRAQIAEMKSAYEQRIAALEARLAKAETKVEAPAVAAAPASGTAATIPVQMAGAVPPAERQPRATAQASSFNPEVSLILQGQYRRMKDVPERGITGFWPAGGHAHAEDGVPQSERRGFSIGHSELVMSANIDPFWRGQLILGLLDGEVEVEEAWFQSLGLGKGLGLKGGRLRSGIGYLNEQHPHAWDFADAPLMYRAMFGSHASYAQDGLQLKWVAPTDTFLEVGVEAGRGATFPGTERNRNGAGSSAIFAHVGGDLGLSSSWRAGLSYLQTSARGREAEFAAVNNDHALGLFDGSSRTWLADFVWKWAPAGNAANRSLTVQGEYFQRREKGLFDCLAEEGGACNDGAGSLSRYASSQSGLYLQSVYQFARNWRAGARYDRLDSGRRDFGVNTGNLVVEDYRPSRVSLMTDYRWSEFSRVRLQVAQDKAMQGITDNQLTLQYIMSLGAHGAHRY